MTNYFRVFLFFFTYWTSISCFAVGFAVNKTEITKKQLPLLYDLLLTQELMTPTLEHAYHGKAVLQILNKELSIDHKEYSRIIRMLIKQEVVELAFITINLQSLPAMMQQEVLNSNRPFGQLLISHHRTTTHQNRKYWRIRCNKQLAGLLCCKSGSYLYGRSNTLVDAKTRQWLAKVFEMLPNTRCLQEKSVYTQSTSKC